MFRTKAVEKIKTHIVCSVTFFSKKVPFMKMCENIVEQDRSHENMAHAHCMLDT